MSSYGGVGKQLKVLFYDFGLGLAHALRMAEDGHQIKYFTPWANGYPNFKEYAPGLGYEKQGLEKVMKFFPHVEWADLIVCVDVGAGDLMDHLRKMGKVCFGSSDKGDELENNREFVRNLQGKIGLPVQKTDVIKGIPALREFLKKNPEKYVKLDIFRADMESFYAKNYEMVEIYLDTLEVALGPFNETYKFMVEDKIEGFEPGIDLFFTNGDWLKPMLWGVEQGKESYVGVYVDELPKSLKLIADKLKKVLTKIDYRGAMSIECRLTKEGVPYMIDICSRYPFPLSTGYTHSIKNYSEVIWKVANSQRVTIQTKGRYFVDIPIFSEFAHDNYLLVDIPDDIKEHVKMRTSAIVKGKTYAIKGGLVVANIATCGNDYKKLIILVEKISEKISGFKVSTSALGSLHTIEEKLKETKQYDLFGF